jgi:hypothetical protein
MPDVFSELPKVSFKFSLDVATVYAIEMALHAHKIKMRVEKQYFSEELLEEWRKALSLPNLFWHLRAFMCGRGNFNVKVKRLGEHIILPLLQKSMKIYEDHWKAILPSLRNNVSPLIKAWKIHGREILRGIRSASRLEWNIKEIKVFFVEPIANGHGDAFLEEGSITFEAAKAPLSVSLHGLTHEIAHLNTADIIYQEDIRRKVLAECANDLVAQQALIEAKMLNKLDFDDPIRDIEKWKTESRQEFLYDPEELKQIMENWWSNHLESKKNIRESIKDLFEEALPKMPLKQ